MNYAVFNPKTNSILTYVNVNKGAIPSGYVFMETHKIPPDATMETINPVLPTPEHVSLRQFRMALKKMELFEKINELRNSPYLSESQKEDLSEFIEYSNIIERNHPLIQAFAPLINVTTEQINNVFRLADTL